jgi:hypothetical protein
MPIIAQTKMLNPTWICLRQPVGEAAPGGAPRVRCGDVAEGRRRVFGHHDDWGPGAQLRSRANWRAGTSGAAVVSADRDHPCVVVREDGLRRARRGIAYGAAFCIRGWSGSPG